jgi:hypothetical protein
MKLSIEFSCKNCNSCWNCEVLKNLSAEVSLWASVKKGCSRYCQRVAGCITKNNNKAQEIKTASATTCGIHHSGGLSFFLSMCIWQHININWYSLKPEIETTVFIYHFTWSRRQKGSVTHHRKPSPIMKCAEHETATLSELQLSKSSMCHMKFSVMFFLSMKFSLWQ